MTCVICKANAHTGDCPKDTALQLLFNVADHNDWQRCHACRRLVELDIGCNHMTYVPFFSLLKRTQQLTDRAYPDVTAAPSSVTSAANNGIHVAARNGTKTGSYTVRIKSLIDSRSPHKKHPRDFSRSTAQHKCYESAMSVSTRDGILLGVVTNAKSVTNSCRSTYLNVNGVS